MTKKRFSCVTSENYSNNFADFFEQQGSGSWKRTAVLLSCFVLKSTRLPAIFSILNKLSILFKILAFLLNGITTCFCPCIEYWTSHSKAVRREILLGDDQSEGSPRFALGSPSSREVQSLWERGRPVRSLHTVPHSCRLLPKNIGSCISFPQKRKSSEMESSENWHSKGVLFFGLWYGLNWLKT